MESLVTQNVMHASLCHMTSVEDRCVGQGDGWLTGGTVRGDRGGQEGR